MSSNASAQVSDAFWPSFSSTRSTLNPGALLSATKQEMPRLPASGSVTAKNTMLPGSAPLLMNCFAPFTTQRSPLAHRAGTQRRGVRARLRLGQAEGADMPPGRERAQPAILLRVGAELVQHLAGRRVVHGNQGGDRAVPGRDLLDQHRVSDRIELRAVPRGGRGRAQDAELAQRGDDFRLDPLRLLARRRAGREPLLAEAAAHFHDHRIGFDHGAHHGSERAHSNPPARIRPTGAT